MENPIAHGIYTISDREFKLFQELIYRETGIFLPAEKKLLLVSRLSKRLRALGLSNFSRYYDYLHASPDTAQELIMMINRITTNKTDFFREPHHFEYLKNELFPQFKRDNQKNIRIWSAGCSTGEEAYSLALTVAEIFGEKPVEDIKILATDLDTSVLEWAEKGIFTPERVTPIPKLLLAKYMSKLNDGSWEIKTTIKRMIYFRRLNLITPKFPFTHGFDIIFCRNVLIYFKKEDRFALIEKLHSVLRENGCLFLGHSESLLNNNLGFQLLRNTIYRKSS
ncbi:MAG: protein-glutamate O-methyltransferase CheR [Spirochaetota bacterium]